MDNLEIMAAVFSHILSVVLGYFLCYFALKGYNEGVKRLYNSISEALASQNDLVTSQAYQIANLVRQTVPEVQPVNQVVHTRSDSDEALIEAMRAAGAADIDIAQEMAKREG